MIDTSQAFGRFRIDREIGRGGQSVVYLAQDTRLARMVALKVLSHGSGFDRRLIERFKREAEAAARLDHPGICTVHEAGVHRGVHYIAMRHVEGETLSRRIARVRKEPARGRRREDLMHLVQLLERTARAVQAAHESGVIHRDLKPGNIMVTPGGDPVILDFGLAHDEESPVSLSLSGDLFGTPAYMAPEQIRSDGHVDERTDVYALGATLYECLTLHPPFEAPTREALYRAILFQEPVDPRRLNPLIPGDLAVVIETALAKEPNRRYQTAGDLAEDLRRARSLEPIRARRAGTFLRYRRWSRRNPALALSVNGLILVLAVALVVTGYLLRHQRAALADTNRLHDIRTLPHLVQVAAEERWPALPAGIPDMSAWLGEAEPIHARLETHRTYLETRRPSVHEDSEAQHEHNDVVRLVAGLERLGPTIARVRQRRADASTISRRTIDAHQDAWAAAIEAIADAKTNPQYGGLRIDPQVGLIPIGQDPASRLFEFAHPQTGEVPARDPTTGRLHLSEETGLVFVLVPGGAFDMGAEPPTDRKREGSPNVDPHMGLDDDERPVHRVELDPFLISKFEMTQGQWLRVTGENPNKFVPESKPHPAYRWYSLLWPVHRLTTDNAEQVLARLGLALPTEAQWEYAARAGTTTVWWTGNEPDGVLWAENIAKRHPTPAPVGTHRPNPFGLHDIAGNVREVVRDWHGSYELPVNPGDGERQVRDRHIRLCRGGGYRDPAHLARSAWRGKWAGGGVRPARPLTTWDTGSGVAGSSRWAAGLSPTNAEPLGPPASVPSPARGAARGSFTVRVDPAATFLHSGWADNLSPPAVPVPLGDLGIQPGDRIRLERLGDWAGTYSSNDDLGDMIAVFSGSAVLLPPRRRHRVQDAIDAGQDVITFRSNLVLDRTDIAEDFEVAGIDGTLWEPRRRRVDGVSVVVPEGATHLFVTSHQSFYEDSVDPDGDFAVRITAVERGDDFGPRQPEPIADRAPGISASSEADASLPAGGTARRSFTVPVDPRATFLRATWPDDVIPPADPIFLVDLGIQPGDRLRLERLGDWALSEQHSDDNLAMIAVFSGSDVLLLDRLHRVANAIDAGLDVNTLGQYRVHSVGVQWAGQSNIPEDFAVADFRGTFAAVCIVVPLGATHLFVTAHTNDSRFMVDPDGDFAVRITVRDDETGEAK